MRSSDETICMVQNKHKVANSGRYVFAADVKSGFREGSGSNAVTECGFLAPRLAGAGSFDEAKRKNQLVRRSANAGRDSNIKHLRR
jgi:hypothetical protein